MRLALPHEPEQIYLQIVLIGSLLWPMFVLIRRSADALIVHERNMKGDPKVRARIEDVASGLV